MNTASLDEAPYSHLLRRDRNKRTMETGVETAGRPKVQVVRPETLFGWGRTIVAVVLCALLVNVLMRLILVVRTVPPKWELWLYLGLALIIVLAPVPFFCRRLRGVKVLAFAVLYGFAVASFSRVIEEIYDVYYLETGGQLMPLLSRSGTRPLFVDELNLFQFGTIGSLVVWWSSRLLRGSIIIQDGHRCPNCAYNLRGCASRICPECGHEFTRQELGSPTSTDIENPLI